MQLLQYFAVFTQMIHGSNNSVTPPRSRELAEASTDSEIVTNHPIEIRLNTETILDSSTIFEAPTATETVIVYTADADEMAEHPKKFTLPPLPYGYDALEPYISKQIMELHHTKHHQTYVNNLNSALKEHAAAFEKDDVKKQIELQRAIKFNGGGHINHSLFWTNLTPATNPAASPSAAPQLKEAIEKRWGSYDNFKETFSKTLLGIQGSGWGWLVKDKNRGGLSIETTKDQDPVMGDKIPIFGVDMWEHAYYLQYFNDKASYVKGIWNVINWETAESRFKDESTLTGFSSLKL